MPWVKSRPLPLEALLDPEAASRCARRIADAGGDRLTRNTRRLTPVDDSPYRDKPGRPRGTARASVQRSDVERFVRRGSIAFRVRTLTHDPVFPHIEWPTRPHVIRARKARALSWRGPGGRAFAASVQHPGTRGQYPFLRGALATEREVRIIAVVPLRRFAQELTAAYR